jgi:hypothetical protein
MGFVQIANRMFNSLFGLYFSDGDRLHGCRGPFDALATHNLAFLKRENFNQLLFPALYLNRIAQSPSEALK